jgi:hypothetical protein
MKADKGQFDTVLGRMLAKPPRKTAEIKAKRAQVEQPKPTRKSGRGKAGV